MEESQDWWFRDQAQLAYGFDNWTAPSQDWGSIDLDFSSSLANRASSFDGGQFALNVANGTEAYAMFSMPPPVKQMTVGNGQSLSQTQRMGQMSMDDDVYY